MKIMVETHSHTIVSSHAHSTMTENIKAARDAKMEGVCLTNHGPGIEDAPHIWHFQTLSYIPKTVDGIAFFSGIEANIMDYGGALDAPDTLLCGLDWVIAGIHSPCLKKSSETNITNAYIGALRNKYVNCLGHIGQSAYLCDFEKVVKTASELNKIIEINNHSLNGVRPGAPVLCREAALLCKKHNTRIAVSSDAHYHGAIGIYDKALTMLAEINFPEELVINTSLAKFENYLNSRKR
jgi:putative hydrolase